MNSRLSSYQNPEGTLQDRLVPRTDMRLPMFNPEWFRGKTVLDLGCNNGYFTRLAIKSGAKRAVGVDIGACIEGARLLAEQEGVACEFWQLNMEDELFQKFCPKFDVVLLLSALAKMKDKDRFLKWLDTVVQGRLIFESNHGEVHKQDIDLVRKHIYFKYVDYLGASEIPEKPHYLWDCQKIDHTKRYGIIASAPLEFIPIDKIVGWGERDILHQKTRYDIESEEFARLKEDIKEHGLKEFLVVNERNGVYEGFQGGHRYLACKQLGYKYIPCKVLHDKFFKHLGQTQ